MRNHSQGARTGCLSRYPYPYLALALAVPVAFMVSTLVHAAPIDLKAQMSAAQYRAAGLDQLTATQLESLNAWLAENQTDAAGADPVRNKPKPPATTVDRFGREQIEKKAVAKPEIVEAQIAGEFRGWDGKTLFRLNNGQIWQQRVGGRYRYRATDPAVRIHRARFGYYLEIAATGRKVGVKRVK